MINQADKTRLRDLTLKYGALTYAEEHAGAGDAWLDEYWQIVDRLIDEGLDRPLERDLLIDLDFWSPKYDAFWEAHYVRNLSPLKKFFRAVFPPRKQKRTASLPSVPS